MSTLGELRGRLRVVLGDGVAGSYLWSDETLNRFLADAVAAYSRDIPRQRTAEVAVVAGTRSYALPADCTGVVRVWSEGAGRELGRGEEFEVWGGELRLVDEPTAADTLKAYYLGSHAALGADGDVSSVPAGDEDLVVSLAGAMAAEFLAGDEAKRRVYEGRGGVAVGEVARVFRGTYENGVRAARRGLRQGRLVSR